MLYDVTATNIHSEFRSKLEMNEAFFPLFTGELAFLQGTIHKGRLLKEVGRWVHQKKIY